MTGSVTLECVIHDGQEGISARANLQDVGAYERAQLLDALLTCLDVDDVEFKLFAVARELGYFKSGRPTTGTTIKIPKINKEDGSNEG